MASSNKSEPTPQIDLSKWRNVPNVAMVIGGVLCVIGAFVNTRQFAFSWLLAFMFFLSFCLGGFVLTLLHHLFDASWSVGIRRINEQLACMFPVMAGLFIPIAVLAPKYIYAWMGQGDHPDHALLSKFPLFTIPGFYVIVVLNFGLWSFFALRLRYWSLQQDQTGSATCTYRMRRLAAFGIIAYALTTTLAAIMWMKALQHQWFSTMYGVWFFAGSTWVTLFTLYLIVTILKRNGPLKDVVGPKQIYFIGSLIFAFTVFHAYVTFSQYFIIWNANIPEETFWYVIREKGTWWHAGVIFILGHFFVPFLGLLRIDVKHKLWWMFPLICFAWLMHFLDLVYNIVPVLHPEGFYLHWMDFAAMACIGGVFTKIFVKRLWASPIYPQRDPRIAEGLDIYVPPAAAGKMATQGGGH